MLRSRRKPLVVGRSRNRNIFVKRQKSPLPGIVFMLLTGCIVAGAAYWFLYPKSASKQQARQTLSEKQAKIQPQIKSKPKTDDKLDASIQKQPVIATSAQILRKNINPGDTASALLSPYLSSSQIHELGQACQKIYPLTKLRVGNPYRLKLKDKNLLGFEYEIDDAKILKICFNPEQSPENFKISTEAIKYNFNTQIVSASITCNLFSAVQSAGEKPELAVHLADIFAWDIDFVRGLRKNDNFTAIVEKRTRDSKPAGYGHILAAKFTNRGETFYAFRFKDSSGLEAYYDEKGQALRKAFLKAPLSFTRISSGYSNSRLHPILKIRRPHHGIDYAAPTGTPIKTIGDGTVIAKARGKGAGRYVKVRHLNGYETVYMHMSRYAKNLRVGKRVHQGEVIGYVGSSGYATGPHLDFRVKRYGKYMNPLKVKSPAAHPVPQKERKIFFSQISPLMAQLQKTTMQASKKNKKELPTG